MREEIYYAHLREDGSHMHFYPKKLQVKLCGSQPIVRVRLTEVPDGRYWGWEDTGTLRWTIIWGSEKLLEMCFPYGTQNAMEKGKGRRVRLNAEEITDA